MTPSPDVPPTPTITVDATARRGAPDPDRPRYRVLVTPSRDDDDDDDARVRGYALEVTRVDVAWRREAGDRALDPLLTKCVPGPPLDPAAARRTVVRCLRMRSAPHPCGATPADVELYLRLDDA